VAEAVPQLGDKEAVLRRALDAMVHALPLRGLDASMRKTVREEAARLLRRPDALARHVPTLCNTPLWDFIPFALARVSGRPLHIYSGDVRSGLVHIAKVSEGGASTVEPIRLMRSCDEYNSAHFDLVGGQAMLGWRGRRDAVARHAARSSPDCSWCATRSRSKCLRTRQPTRVRALDQMLRARRGGRVHGKGARLALVRRGTRNEPLERCLAWAHST
jgi:hypothetical protein